MYCSKCGKEINEGTNFCPYCGNQLNQQIVQTNTKEVRQIPDGFLDKLALLRNYVLEIENKQYGVDLCNIVIGSTPGVQLKTMFKNTVESGLSGLFSGQVDGVKAITELKKKYGIGSAGNIAGLVTIGGISPFMSSYKKGAERLQNEISSIISNNMELFRSIPTRYLNSLCIEYLMTIISENRANSLNDALDKLDQQIHYWIVENKMNNIENILQYWKTYDIFVIW